MALTPTLAVRHGHGVVYVVSTPTGEPRGVGIFVVILRAMYAPLILYMRIARQEVALAILLGRRLCSAEMALTTLSGVSLSPGVVYVVSKPTH